VHRCKLQLGGEYWKRKRKGGELSSENQGMKVAGRIWEMLKGPEYTLKKRVLTGLTISKSMHIQPQAFPDQRIGTNLCTCKAGERRERESGAEGHVRWGWRLLEALRGLEP